MNEELDELCSVALMSEDRQVVVAALRLVLEELEQREGDC